MMEERKAKVLGHIHRLEKVLRFHFPESNMGKSVAPDTLLGAMAETLTRIDELRAEKADLVDRLQRAEERIADLVRDGMLIDKRLSEIDQCVFAIKPFGGPKS
jgi:hypothetical protein